MSGLSKYALSLLLSSALALILTFLFREYPIKRAVPVVFALLLVSITHFFGRVAGLLSALVGGLTFAAFLFEPYGSLAVGSTTDRVTLFCFAIFALILVYVFPQPHQRENTASGTATFAQNEHWIAVGIAILALLISLIVLFRLRKGFLSPFPSL